MTTTSANLALIIIIIIMLSQAVTNRCPNLCQQQNSMQLVLDQPWWRRRVVERGREQVTTDIIKSSCKNSWHLPTQ